MVTPSTSVQPFAAPTQASPKIMQLASLATAAGRPRSASRAARMGAPGQPGRLPQVPATMPLALSIWPVADTPTPAGWYPAARQSASIRTAAARTVSRMGVR